MSLIEFEVAEVRKLCENVVPNSKLIACTASGPVPFVRVNINQLTACLRFPVDYPAQPILVELKSKDLNDKFLDGLAKLCESRAQKSLNKPQVLEVLRFIQQYVQENPLCVCFDEIQQLRSDLGTESAAEQLKLKQRTSTVQLNAIAGAYYYRVKAIVPHDYPLSCVQLQQPETNLPAVLLRYLNGQSREIARQCVEAPLRVNKAGHINFQAKPSVYLALKFCLEATRDFPNEQCPICNEYVLPPDPANLVLDDSKDAFVERVYCGHLFHQGCLKQYLQEPPFPKSGKLCPAQRRHARSDASYYLGGGCGGGKHPSVAADTGGKCDIRLAHDRWVVNVKIAETRWAQKQARERELQEVVDFLK